MLRSVLLVAALSAMPAVAQATCLDDVDKLASRSHIAASLPKGTSSGGNLSQTLAASGGVIAPPPTGDMAEATPPVPGGDSMATAPAIAPQGATPPVKGAEAPEHAAAAQTQAASLLQAARDAAKDGNETVCRQRLADAQKLLAGGTATP